MFHFENFCIHICIERLINFMQHLPPEYLLGTKHTDVLKVTEKKVSLRLWKKSSGEEEGVPGSCPLVFRHTRRLTAQIQHNVNNWEIIFLKSLIFFFIYPVQRLDICSEYCWDFWFYIWPHLVSTGLKQHFELLKVQSLYQQHQHHLGALLNCRI